MLERHMEVLVQHEVAQLLAVEWCDELCAILLVLAVGARSRYALDNL